MAFEEITLTNQAIRKMIKGQPVELTCTLGSTGAAVAYLLPNWTIVVVCTAALHANNVVITTPIAFRVVHVQTIQNATTNSATVIVSNGGDNITDTITLGANKAVVKATSIDDAYYEFDEDDDDLTLEVGTAALTGVVIIKIFL